MARYLASRINSYRDSFEGALSDLRFPGRIGRSAGATVMGNCTVDREVEIYDMFHTPGAYMPPTGFVVMTHDTSVNSLLRIFVLGET